MTQFLLPIFLDENTIFHKYTRILFTLRPPRPPRPVAGFKKKTALMAPASSMAPPLFSCLPTCPVFQASICHTERRKTKREKRRLAYITRARNRIIANSLTTLVSKIKKEK
jgi:hypothetical protein